MTYGNYPDHAGIKKILVVKMRHHGDVLLTAPVFTNLRKAFPEAEIDAYLYADTLPMLEGHPAISRFLLYDRKWKKLSFFHRLLKEAALLWKIRKAGYDLVVNLTEGDRGAIAASFSRSPYRVGFAGKRKGYTHVVKQCSSPRHAVEKNLDALRAIGIFPTPEERDLTLVIPETAQEKIAAHGLEEKGFVLIHPTSRWRFKCPPPSFFIELIQKLHSQGEKIVLSSGPDAAELKMIDQILQGTRDIPITILAGKTTLKELAALIDRAACLISVDSVPVHIASALKTPVVAIFGPSSDENWGPWMHPQARIVAKKTSCRPCFLDGCGGSKMSDCLFTLPVSDALTAFNSL